MDYAITIPYCCWFYWVCVSRGGGGAGGGMFDDRFVYIETMCFGVGCFYLEYEMYAPRAHLKKGALRPHFYHGLVC